MDEAERPCNQFQVVVRSDKIDVAHIFGSAILARFLNHAFGNIDPDRFSEAFRKWNHNPPDTTSEIERTRCWDISIEAFDLRQCIGYVPTAGFEEPFNVPRDLIPRNSELVITPK